MISDTKNHGMNWGWYKRVGPGWRIMDQSRGGDYQRVNSIDECQDPNVHLVKLGNDFGKGWIRHTDIPHSNWHFWDNPLVPQFLYPNAANPQGAKDWIRWVPGAILSHVENTEVGHEQRINALLSQLAGQAMTWRDIITTHGLMQNSSRKILLTPSSTNCYIYYYGDTRAEWIRRNTERFTQLGYTVEVWDKPTRQLRVKGTQWRLYDRLLKGDVRATVSQHSASAIESICAGVPVITTGPHPAGKLATNELNFFADGELVTASRSTVDEWIINLFSHLRHKSEIFSGAWNDKSNLP
jgi:hypothetical protein